MIDYSATVTCDSCGESADVDVTEYAGDPYTVGVEDSTLTELGWVVRDGQHLCEDCSEDDDD